MAEFIRGSEAVARIKPGDHVCVIGCLNLLEPETILHELEQSFLKSGRPNNLTVMFPVAVGRLEGKGLDHLAHPGLVKRVIGGSFASVLPNRRLNSLIFENKVEAYNIPMGSFFNLLRNTGAGQPGLMTAVGLNTYADPRFDGGRLNEVTKEQIVEVKQLDGKEWLYYRRMKVDVAVIRGTSSDAAGNISLEGEPSSQGILAMAMAAKNNGGIVIAQVRRTTERGSVHPKQVLVPARLVDYVVIDERDEAVDQHYPPSVTGESRQAVERTEPAPLDEKKIIQRRALIEMAKGSLVNLGFGLPAGIPAVALEEGVVDDVCFTVEHGPIGGIPGGMGVFGVAMNPDAILDNTSVFDLYAGGALDMTCLGMGEVDQHGNVNNHKFKHIIAGSGGFTDITHVTPKIVLAGTFTAGGLKTRVENGKLQILQEGKFRKFNLSIEGVTLSASETRRKGQKVLYVTERAVFELGESGMRLVEIAPGIDLQRDILDLLEFDIEVSANLKAMDAAIFRPEKMGVRLAPKTSPRGR
jgi:propionate CoA-transferase